MNGSIVMAVEYPNNITNYVVLGYYDNAKSLTSALSKFVSLLTKSYKVSVKTYNRKDGYVAVYVHCK